MRIFKKTRMAFMSYIIPGTLDTGHYVVVLEGFFWTVTKSELLNSISQGCDQLKENYNAVITEIKIIK